MGDIPLEELRDAIADYYAKPESKMRMGHLEAMLFESLMAVQDKLKEGV